MMMIRFYDHVDQARHYYSLLMNAVLFPLQRVQELERENCLLKEEKEEMNQKILRQSQSSGGEFHTSLRLRLWKKPTHTHRLLSIVLSWSKGKPPRGLGW